MISIQPFQFKETHLVSFEFFQLCRYVRNGMGFLQLYSYLILVYVVLKQSPLTMGAYKWYILINSTQGLLLGLFAALFDVYPLAPYPVYVLLGPFRNLNISPLVVFYLANSTVIMVSASVYTSVMMFVFRYVQTTESRYADLLSNFWLYFLGYVLFYVFVYVAILLPMNCQTMFPAEIKAAFREVDPKVYALIENEPLVYGLNIEEKHYYWISLASTAFAIGLATAIVFYTSLRTFLSLKHNRKNLYPATQTLFKRLLIILMIDIMAGSTGVLLPFSFVVVSQALQLQWTNTIATLALIFPEIYPLMVNSILILYVRPYRECFFGMLHKLCCVMGRRSTTNVEVTFTKVSQGMQTPR